MQRSIIVALLAFVVVLGVGMYVTDFTVYLGNDPAACNNCHVMDAAYEGWYHAPHSKWAACADCHTPHDLIPKYIVKTENGMRHVSAFVLNNIPNPIRMIPASKEVVQENCIRCHADTVDALADGQMDTGRYCFDCHRDIAHGPRGVSVLPYQEEVLYEEHNK